VFNRLYQPEWPDTDSTIIKARPWVAMCTCPWVTFHRSWRSAFGYAVRHTCPPPAGFR
jgi:hypothetical protein